MKSSQALLEELTAGRFTKEERAEMDSTIGNFVSSVQESYAGLEEPGFFDFQFMKDYLRCSVSKEELNERMSQISENYKEQYKL